jgi:hypothetical protein
MVCKVIVGDGWHVLERLSKSANMGRWQVGGPTLAIVDAVCALMTLQRQGSLHCLVEAQLLGVLIVSKPSH